MRTLLASSFVVLGIVAAGCTSAEVSEDAAPALSTEDATSCNNGQLPAADRTRKAVVSHPFGTNPGLYEVLNLSAAGKLSRTGKSFTMGKANSYAPIVFTPSGRIGLAAQQDGTIGVFRFETNGNVTVVNKGWSGGFYTTSIVMDPSGTKAYALDGNVEINGGGVYQIAIACDGTLTTTARTVTGNVSTAMSLFPNDTKRAVLYSMSAGSSDVSANAHRVDLSRTPATIEASGDAFGDQAAHSSAVAVTRDGKYALVGDDGIQMGDRLAVVDTTYLKHRQIFTSRAPFAIVMSPWGNAAMVVNGDDADSIEKLKYTGNEDAPFTQPVELTYAFPKPLLPGAASAIERGQLKGRVLVGELLAVRQVQFTSAGDVKDVAQLTWPDGGNENILGTIGVQP